MDSYSLRILTFWNWKNVSFKAVGLNFPIPNNIFTSLNTERSKSFVQILMGQSFLVIFNIPKLT